MKPATGILIIIMALIAGIQLSNAEVSVDPALIAAAQKAMPGGISASQLNAALEAGLWNSDRTTVGISISVAHPEPSIIFVLLRQPDGSYLAADAGLVEDGNLGKIGILGRKGYDRFVTAPVEWLPRDDGLFQVRMRTRAWRAGKRYTVYEPLIIKPDGTVLFR